MINIVRLNRTDYREYGTYGELTLPGGQKLVTVERPWKDNQRSISCIPEGEYLCVPRPFHRGGYDAWEVTGVPDRSLILIHIANVPPELAGCIAPGMAFGHVDTPKHPIMWGVTQSGNAFRYMMDIMGKDSSFPLIITGAQNEQAIEP